MFKKTLHVLTTLFLLFAFCTVSFAQERLILIGGGERPASAMARFIEWSGFEKAKILVIPWASGEPQASFESLKKQLEGLSKNPLTIESAPFKPLNETTRADFLRQLTTSTGVFFTGGDQARIMEVLQDETLLKALQEKYKSGTVFGGTSAGTAIMSAKMITGEGDFTVIDGTKVETKKGLGLLPEVIVDQHFIKRQRQNRLIGLILQNPTLLGIGIDEDTAFVVTDNRFGEVLGASQVMIFDTQKDRAMRFLLLKNGERFDLKKRKRN